MVQPVRLFLEAGILEGTEKVAAFTWIRLGLDGQSPYYWGRSRH